MGAISSITETNIFSAPRAKTQDMCKAQACAKTIDYVASELICPILRELFVDPVMAEDGHTYERASIQTHIEVCQSESGAVRSPMTNLPMGTRLIDNKILRTVICSLVGHTGDRQEWNKREVERKNGMGVLVAYRKKAMSSSKDTVRNACWHLGYLYARGKTTCGLSVPRDEAEGTAWFSKGESLGCFNCKGELAYRYLEGIGLPVELKENFVSIGLVKLGEAVAGGSQFALYVLGRAHKYGFYGMREDRAAVTKYFRLALRATKNVVSDKCLEKMHEWIAESEELDESDELDP